MLKVDRVREIIDHERGLKRGYVAERIGLRQSSFQQILKGVDPMSLKYAIELSRVLKVPLSEIWSEKQ